MLLPVYKENMINLLVINKVFLANNSSKLNTVRATSKRNIYIVIFSAYYDS